MTILLHVLPRLPPIINIYVPECLKNIIDRTYKVQIKFTSYNFTITLSCIIDEDEETNSMEENLNVEDIEEKYDTTAENTTTDM